MRWPRVGAAEGGGGRERERGWERQGPQGGTVILINHCSEPNEAAWAARNQNRDERRASFVSQVYIRTGASSAPKIGAARPATNMDERRETVH